MSGRDRDPEDVLAALGALHRQEQAELAAFEAQALEWTAVDPAHQRALDERLFRELGVPAGAPSAVQRPRIKRSVVAGLGAAAVALAAAAAVLLVPSPPTAAPAFTLIPPPSDAEVRSSERATTGAAEAVYTLGRTLRFTLRPATRYQGPLEVTCAAHQGNRSVAFVPDVRVDEAGSRTLTVTTGRDAQLDVPSGQWELRCHLRAESDAQAAVKAVFLPQLPN
jgi:hypothetical protein